MLVRQDVVVPKVAVWLVFNENRASRLALDRPASRRDLRARA